MSLSDPVEFTGFLAEVSSAIRDLREEPAIIAAVQRLFAQSQHFEATLWIGEGDADRGVTNRIHVPLTVNGAIVGSLSITAASDRGDLEPALRILADTISACLERARARAQVERLAEELRRTEERSRVLSETMSDFVYALRTEPDGTLKREWTAGDIKRMTGYTLDEMDERGGVMSIVHPDDRAIVMRRAFALMSKQPYSSEYRIIDKGGRVRWIRYYTHPLTDEGEIGETRIYGAAKDITEAIESEQALRASEEKYRSIVETISEVIYEFDQNGVVSYVSPAVENLLGYTTDEITGRHFRELVAPEDMMRVLRGFRNVLSGLGGGGEYRVRAKSGEIRWVRTDTQPVYDGEALMGVRGVLVDVTDRVRSDEQLRAYRDDLEILVGQRTSELRAANERLALLSQRLMHAQEDERRRIARELHDEIGQELTALRITLQAARKAHPAPHIEDGVRIAEQTLQQVRDLSLDLRPSLLDDLGLVPALRWYLDRQAQRAGLSIDFAADVPDERLPPDLEVACFRFVQEAFTNVVRHAQATRVTVRLRKRDGDLELTVEDDGVGFDVAETFENAAKGESIGLLGMRERAQLASGEMEILAAEGQGAIIRARFPLGAPPVNGQMAATEP